MVNSLLVTDWVAIITALGVIVALVSNVSGIANRGKKQAAEVARLNANIENIIKTLDEMKDDLRNIPQRVTIVETSLKSAHKRIDQIERR